MHRRQFIRSGSALGVSLAMTQPWDRVLGANDDIRVGVVGFRSRGKVTSLALETSRAFA